MITDLALWTVLDTAHSSFCDDQLTSQSIVSYGQQSSFSQEAVLNLPSGVGSRCEDFSVHTVQQSCESTTSTSKV